MNALVEAARGGSIRAASRLISCIDERPSHAWSWLAASANWPAPRLTLGVTGAPGAGKSQLISALVGEWRKRLPEERIGVLAVDPSSPRSGGAVLGDRIRMMEHATDEQVFIRSLANRGRLGGLTAGIRGALGVMGLVGCDVVLVETVGVGQNEVEIARVADLAAVVLSPGAGDAVQLLKSGLLEIADLVVVNKADRPGAERLFAELNAMLALGDPTRERPPTFLVSSLAHRGVEKLVDGIERLAAARNEIRADRRDRSLRQEVAGAVRESAVQWLDRSLNAGTVEERTIERILRRETTVERAAAELLEAAARLASAAATDDGVADGRDIRATVRGKVQESSEPLSAIA